MAAGKGNLRLTLAEVGQKGKMAAIELRDSTPCRRCFFD
jgi:hypothetical protein